MKPRRENSRLEACRCQQQLQLPEGNVLKFVDVCIMELDPDEHAALINREWESSELVDKDGRVLQRWEKEADPGSRGRQSAPSTSWDEGHGSHRGMGAAA